jgi:hypothetical protein
MNFKEFYSRKKKEKVWQKFWNGEKTIKKISPAIFLLSFFSAANNFAEF